MASDASPASLQNGILVCWWSFVVALTPDEVPGSCNSGEASEHNGSVVHGLGGDREEGGHTEERDGESGPYCEDVSL